MGQTTYALSLTNLTFADDGDYSLVVTSGSDVATSTVATLTVRFCTDSPAGLVAWWPGDGSGLDVSGNHHGAVWGGTTYPEGIVGRAFGFNGTDAYVAAPDSPALSPHVGTNGEMSLEAWVYLTELPQTDPYTGEPRRCLMAKGDSGRWEYGIAINTNGVPEFAITTPAGAYVASVWGGQIVLNQWAHLVGVLKKGQFIRIYQDGQLMVESTTFTNDAADTGSPLYIGRRANGQFLEGSVDEVAIYSRALDAGEIATLYASGAFGKCYGPGTPAPFFAVHPISQSGYLFLNAGLAGLALGTPRPDYQWYRSNSPSSWIAIPGATNATLIFTNLTGSEEGHYRLSASNQYGTATSMPTFISVVEHDILTAGEVFEKGWNGWTSDNYALWQVGRPSAGPPVVNGEMAHSGTNCAGTILGGNYPQGVSSRLVSPPLGLPAIVAGEEVVLRFWQWFSYYSGWWNDGCNSGWGGNDAGEVQIQVFGQLGVVWVLFRFFGGSAAN